MQFQFRQINSHNYDQFGNLIDELQSNGEFICLNNSDKVLIDTKQILQLKEAQQLIEDFFEQLAKHFNNCDHLEIEYEHRGI